MKILIVEDHPSVAKGLRRLFEQSHDEPITVYLADNLPTAHATFEVERPEVVLLDLDLPGSTPYETVNRVSDFEGAQVLICSANDDRDLVLKAFKNGAQDFLVKGTDIRIVQRTIFAYLRHIYARR